MLRDAGTLRTRLTISDTGHGVAHEDRSRLLSAGFTTKPWGHGLGLHSLAVFLASRNGSVKLESEGRGKGAILVIEVADA
jgi:signal transduction histidine kinase